LKYQPWRFSEDIFYVFKQIDGETSVIFYLLNIPPSISLATVSGVASNSLKGGDVDVHKSSASLPDEAIRGKLN